MEIISVINQLSWPAALAIVGSVGTIVFGIFQYLRTMKAKEANPAQLVHNRVSNLKDVVSGMTGDVKAVLARIEGIEQSLRDHEKRDAADVKAMSDKMDKIMEIIVEVLKDDRYQSRRETFQDCLVDSVCQQNELKYQNRKRSWFLLH